MAGTLRDIAELHEQGALVSSEDVCILGRAFADAVEEIKDVISIELFRRIHSVAGIYCNGVLDILYHLVLQVEDLV